MTKEQFAEMCMGNLRLRTDGSFYGNSVNVFLEVYDGSDWVTISHDHIHIPSDS